MTKRIDLNDVRLLMQVVEHGSYTAAALATGIPKSTVSQRIAALEALVGTGLLRRTSRSFSLTEAGARLIPHARAIEELSRQVEQSFLEQGDDLQGTLRVSCSKAIAQFALSALVPRFLQLHQHAAIQVDSTNRLVDLVSEGFDMTIRGHVGPLKDSILIQRVLARTHWALAAAPRWLEKHGTPAEPEQVPATETLCFSSTPDPADWKLTRAGEERHIKVAGRLISDDMLAIRASCILAGGVARLPAYLMRSAFDAGDLVRLLPDWDVQASMISVITPPKAQSSRLAAAFSDFLAAEMPAMVRD